MESTVVAKLLREGDLLLEVDLVAQEQDDDPWSPYFAPDQAQKLFDAKKALVDGDMAKAERLGRLYSVSPLPAAA